MIAKTPATILFLALWASLSSCEAINMAPTPNQPLLARDAARVINVDQYFSQYMYGPTLRLYDYGDARLVLALRFSNRQSPVQYTAALHEFAPGTPREEMKKWLNNQHSDALYPDAAEPLRTSNVTDRVTISREELMREEAKPGRSGESYMEYELTFRVQPIGTRAGRLAAVYRQDDRACHS